MTEEKQLIKDEFLKSRNGAIVRCASIMIASGRKDLAKQILAITKIDRNQFEAIKRQNT
jgi:hypothetical protein